MLWNAKPMLLNDNFLWKTSKHFVHIFFNLERKWKWKDKKYYINNFCIRGTIGLCKSIKKQRKLFIKKYLLDIWKLSKRRQRLSKLLQVFCFLFFRDDTFSKRRLLIKSGNGKYKKTLYSGLYYFCSSKKKSTSCP